MREINVTKWNPDPDYLREVLDQASIGQREAARIIGINERTFRSYLTGSKINPKEKCPYAVQFCLECLADEVQGR